MYNFHSRSVVSMYDIMTLLELSDNAECNVWYVSSVSHSCSFPWEREVGGVCALTLPNNPLRNLLHLSLGICRPLEWQNIVSISWRDTVDMKMRHFGTLYIESHKVTSQIVFHLLHQVLGGDVHMCYELIWRIGHPYMLVSGDEQSMTMTHRWYI